MSTPLHVLPQYSMHTSTATIWIIIARQYLLDIYSIWFPVFFRQRIRPENDLKPKWLASSHYNMYRWGKKHDSDLKPTYFYKSLFSMALWILTFLSKPKDTGRCDWTDLSAYALLRFTWLELWGQEWRHEVQVERKPPFSSHSAVHTHTHTHTPKCLGHIQPHSPPNWLPIINAGSLCSCFVQRNALLHVAIYWQQYNSLIWSCFTK